MTTERQMQIATAITTISEVYERELSVAAVAAVAIYVTTLQRFEPQLIIKALQRHVEDPERGRFMPRPADIIVHLTADSSATAFNAWTDVLNVIHHNKAQRNAISDPLVHQIVHAMGGWSVLRYGREDELPHRFEQFMRHYRQISTSQALMITQQPATPKQLTRHTTTGSNPSWKHSQRPPTSLSQPSRRA